MCSRSEAPAFRCRGRGQARTTVPHLGDGHGLSGCERGSRSKASIVEMCQCQNSGLWTLFAPGVPYDLLLWDDGEVGSCALKSGGTREAQFG